MNTKKFKCKICKLKYVTKVQCATHEARHRKSKVCEVCGYTTTNYLLLAEHLTHHYSNEIQFRCPKAGCDKSFFYKSSFKQHLISHSGFKCIDPTCSRRNKQFPSRCTLEDHVKVHLGKLKHACDVCPNKRFANKRSLNAHKKTKRHIEWANFQLKKAAQSNTVPDEGN